MQDPLPDQETTRPGDTRQRNIPKNAKKPNLPDDRNHGAQQQTTSGICSIIDNWSPQHPATGPNDGNRNPKFVVFMRTILSKIIPPRKIDAGESKSAISIPKNDRNDQDLRRFALDRRIQRHRTELLQTKSKGERSHLRRVLHKKIVSGCGDKNRDLTRIASATLITESVLRSKTHTSQL